MKMFADGHALVFSISASTSTTLRPSSFGTMGATGALPGAHHADEGDIAWP